MSVKRYCEDEINTVLKLTNDGRNIPDICREFGISQTTFYNWRRKYQEIRRNDTKKFTDLTRENRKLRKQLKNLAEDYRILEDILTKKP